MPRYYRPYVFFILAGWALLLLSAVFRQPTLYTPRHPTPYKLSYPPYFGNRTNTTDENPLTVEGIGLGRYIRGEYTPTAAEQCGLALFYGNSGCGTCHSGPKVFNETYHNNGLDSVPSDPGRSAITGMDYDRGRFRVVTLRNIALTAPYMHDGRFKTLQEVIDHYSEHILPSPTLSPSLKDTTNSPVSLRLSGEEKADLLSFLQMLTDSVFITDPRFSDPFAIATLKNKTNE
jgi:cytochrome c peroxidase